MMDFGAALRSALEGLDWVPSVDEVQIAAMERHYVKLMSWGKRLNLSAIRDPREVVERHFGESIALAAVLPAGPCRVVDFGSGAGFPGLPLALMRPDLEVELVDSDAKKAVFLREASIGVGNVRVSWRRPARVSCDWLVSRAVAWRDLEPVVLASGCSVGLITTEDLVPRATLHWQVARVLPWRGSSVVAIGTPSVEPPAVSRETSGVRPSSST
jgi:hypothetical protein